MKEVYLVHENDVQCKCNLICVDCDVCVHKYSCTCVDSCIKWNVCKHIHAVYRINKAGRSLQSNVNNNEDDGGDRLFVHPENEIDTTEKQEIDQTRKRLTKLKQN